MNDPVATSPSADTDLYRQALRVTAPTWVAYAASMVALYPGPQSGLATAVRDGAPAVLVAGVPVAIVLLAVLLPSGVRTVAAWVGAGLLAGVAIAVCEVNGRGSVLWQRLLAVSCLPILPLVVGTTAGPDASRRTRWWLTAGAVVAGGYALRPLVLDWGLPWWNTVNLRASWLCSAEVETSLLLLTCAIAGVLPWVRGAPRAVLARIQIVLWPGAVVLAWVVAGNVWNFYVDLALFAGAGAALVVYAVSRGSNPMSRRAGLALRPPDGATIERVAVAVTAGFLLANGLHLWVGEFSGWLDGTLRDPARPVMLALAVAALWLPRRAATATWGALAVWQLAVVAVSYFRPMAILSRNWAGPALVGAWLAVLVIPRHRGPRMVAVGLGAFVVVAGIPDVQRWYESPHLDRWVAGGLLHTSGTPLLCALATQGLWNHRCSRFLPLACLALTVASIWVASGNSLRKGTVDDAVADAVGNLAWFAMVATTSFALLRRMPGGPPDPPFRAAAVESGSPPGGARPADPTGPGN